MEFRFNNCLFPLAMYRKNLPVYSLIIVYVVSLANEEMCMSSSILTYDLPILMQPES